MAAYIIVEFANAPPDGMRLRDHAAIPGVTASLRDKRSA